MNETTSAGLIHGMVPYLRIRGAAAAIDFYTQVFGAKEVFRLVEPGGRVGHAQLRLGPATLMVSDEYPEQRIMSPLAFDGNGSLIHLQVDDVDLLAAKATAAGATMISEPADQFYGERSCRLRDPFGHEWMLGQHIEQITQDEMQSRFRARFQQ
jgi:PhnB protein